MPLRRTRTRKEIWLLGLLAVRGSQPSDRSWLAGTLWPDSTEEQALAYLRSSLYNLRQVLGPDAPRIHSPSPRTVAFDLDGADVDVAEFDRYSRSSDRAELQKAVAAYGGPFLEGCDEPWAVLERDRRIEDYLQALEVLGTEALRNGEPAETLRWFRQALSLDGLRETAVRGIMQALFEMGDRAGAALAYRQFRLRLAEEIRTSPSPQTTALYQQIRTGASKAGAVAPPGAPVRAATIDRHNPSRLQVPNPATTLVGREREIAEIRELLVNSNRTAHPKQIVTLTGPGGIGKTRLAVAAAAVAADDFPDGVTFVDLSALHDGELVSKAVADALGLPEEPGRTLLDGIVAHLDEKRSLVVLDNCEHLLQPTGWLAEALVKRSPYLRIVATSRQALGVSEEAVVRVPALGVPPLDFARYGATSAELLGFDSVRLFVERAMDASGVFALTDRNASSVVRICQRVDGLPLGLELAAARVNALSADQIADRLDESIKLLSRGSKGAPSRQQSLTALIEWSYDLLGDQERSLFRRLSVFSGGWSLEAAEQVCSDRHEDAGAVISSEDVLDLLSELIDRSLVVTKALPDGGLRHDCLETLRQFASGAMRDEGEEELLRDRHLDFFVQLVEKAEVGLEAPDQHKWLHSLETEHDNLRAAFAHALKRDDDSALRLASALRLFWDRHGAYAEGRRWCAAALDTPTRTPLTSLRASTLKTAGLLAYRQADYASAKSSLEQSLAIQRELGDLKGVSAALTNLAIVSHDQGDLETAVDQLNEAIEIDRSREDRRDVAISLTNLSNIEYSRGRFDTARVLQEEAIATWREENDPWRLALSLGNLGSILFETGEIAAAKQLQEESLAIRRRLEDPWNIALALANLGNIAHEERDLATALSLHEESLALREEVGNRNGVAYSLNCLGKISFDLENLLEAHQLHAKSLAIAAELQSRIGVAEAFEGLAPVLAAEGHLEHAAKLWGAADTIRRDISTPRSPSKQRRIDAQMSALFPNKSEPEFTRAWETGAGLTLDAAISLGLGKS